MRTISNTDDVIDSRDVIERIEELEGEREDFEHDDDGNRTAADWALEKDAAAAELAALQALASEVEGYAEDWQYGETLIRGSYFTEYAQEMLEDCREIPKNLPGYIVIDWDATAENLKVDYTAVDFDGVSYYIR